MTRLFTIIKSPVTVLITVFAVLVPASQAQGQSLGLCRFNLQTLSFAGSYQDQARCLLTPLSIGGTISSRPADLGPFLSQNVGTTTDISKGALRRLLVREGLERLARTVSEPVSRARNNSIGAPPAKYFVIHDTSSKFSGSDFPRTSDPRLNRLGHRNSKTGDWVAHTFINPRGEVLMAIDYQTPWRAIRMERDDVTRGVAKGLFLHNELNQARLEDANHRRRPNDRLAPTPGFSHQQYDRLALLFILASVRRGSWLIPAYHAVLDSGIRGGHDDPQHFDLKAWEEAIQRRVAEMRNR